jgi:hypothetical protein
MARLRSIVVLATAGSCALVCLAEPIDPNSVIRKSGRVVAIEHVTGWDALQSTQRMTTGNSHLGLPFQWCANLKLETCRFVHLPAKISSFPRVMP